MMNSFIVKKKLIKVLQPMAFCLCKCAFQLGLKLFQKVHAPQNGGGRSDEKN